MAMHDRDLEVERHDVFGVMQLTRDTPLEHEVAADLVVVEAGQTSNVHRHNRAETVLYILDGESDVLVDDTVLHVRKGDRVLVGKGQFHGFVTHERSVTFLSVQSPPILDDKTGELDFEPRV
jgi:quercetin dioxygenase-like cupin family protein